MQRIPQVSDKYENYHQRYVVNTVLVDDKNTPPEKENPVSHKKPPTTTGTTNANQLFWKWGEEILRPGIDLKNKIILLLEDTLDTLKKTKERTKEEEINHFVDEFSSNLYKTVHEVPERDMKAQSTREDTPKPRNFAGSEENDRSRKKFHPSFGRKDEPISVEYINSQILKWEDTQTTFKFESSDMDSVRAADLKNDLCESFSTLYSVHFSSSGNAF
ncbi:hypothetical protein JTB14_038353 [Gonioctena quinquepunctata]|nr:hypothetical protein JTB14_038353 [Gonioctena quinquepunctata]